MGKTVPIEARIRRMSKLEHDCWVWQGRPSNAGYGQMNVVEDGRTVSRLAHRVSYQTFVGPIPEGMVLDHLCRVRLCVNPAHLEPVTNRENLMRSPLAPAAINAKKTHCPQGHEYTPQNTIRQRQGGRLCRVCQNTGANRTAVAR